MLRPLLIALGLATPALPTLAAPVFPTVTADDLNGRSVTLPAGLPGDPTIVFIAYKRQQQDDVDTWVTALGLDPSTGAQYVEVPVVGSGAAIIRPYVDNGMRSGIVDTAARARTITLYQSPSVVNDPLGFSGRGAIRVLVVRQSGEVLWSTSGPATAEGVAALKSAFAAN